MDISITAAFKEKRVIIAVTQYDVHYTSRGNGEMDEEEVCQYLQKILKKYTIDREQIFVISGEWGLISRLLKSDQGDKKLLNAAKHNVLAMKLSVDDADYDNCHDVVLKMDAYAVAQQLEEASNIKSLEKK